MEKGTSGVSTTKCYGSWSTSDTSSDTPFDFDEVSFKLVYDLNVTRPNLSEGPWSSVDRLGPTVSLEMIFLPFTRLRVLDGSQRPSTF